MPRYPNDPRPKKRPPFFWWTLANILAVAFAISAWIVCLTLFNDPTHPTSYRLMMKVGRLQPLEAFTRQTLPDPKTTLDAYQLERQFLSYSPNELQALNLELRRAYLTNFKKPKFLAYVTGDFRILDSRPLTETDFHPSGTVLKAQALIRPEPLSPLIAYPVFIELLLPSEAPLPSYEIGSTITLERRRHAVAILHVDTAPLDQREVPFLTLIPLLAGPHPSEDSSVKISPPSAVNIEASFPTFP